MTHATTSRLARSLAFAIAVCWAISCRPALADLITNGGFETGDFTGWTVTNTDGQPDNVVTFQNYAGQNMNPYQGTYFALLGTPAADQGGPVELSQVISTTPGAFYNFSFAYFAQPGSPNSFSADFGSTQVLNVLNDNSQTSNPIGWQVESYIVKATGSSTTVALFSGNDPNYNGLDSVSVTRYTPEPSSVALLGVAAVGLAFAARRRRKAASI